MIWNKQDSIYGQYAKTLDPKTEINFLLYVLISLARKIRITPTYSEDTLFMRCWLISPFLVIDYILYLNIEHEE